MVSPSLHPPQYNSPAGGFSPHWPGCSRHMFFPHWPGCSRHIISIRVPLTGYDAAQKGEISKRLVISSFCAARATSRATIPSFQSTHSSQSETIAADRTVSPTHYVATPLHQLPSRTRFPRCAQPSAAPRTPGSETPPDRSTATPLHKVQRGHIQDPQLLLTGQCQQSLDLLQQRDSIFHNKPPK